jgi:hypothetical protein
MQHTIKATQHDIAQGTRQDKTTQPKITKTNNMGQHKSTQDKLRQNNDNTRQHKATQSKTNLPTLSVGAGA